MTCNYFHRVGESSFQISCIASGKPNPTVHWLKDDQNLTADGKLYKVSSVLYEGYANVATVNSTLSFLGYARPQSDEIMTSDRGKYTCVFANEVKRVESTMMLKVEHEPIALHQHGKVAFNLQETAEVACKVQAWPKPEFQWSFGTNVATLQGSSSDGHYEITTTSDNDDIYTSVLRITNIKGADYGDYSCRAINAQGSITTIIRLQSKGPPEKPNNITAIDIGPTHVTLAWELGFDGGLKVVRNSIFYKKLVGSEDSVASDCVSPKGLQNGQWFHLDCLRSNYSNRCNVTGLEQHQAYTFKMKVWNTIHESEFSDETTAITTVAKIPTPLAVKFDQEGGTLTIHVGATCLALIASVERLYTEGTHEQWRIVDEWALDVLGSAPTQREVGLEDPDTILDESRIRVRLCLKSDRQKCGGYAKTERKSI